VRLEAAERRQLTSVAGFGHVLKHTPCDFDRRASSEAIAYRANTPADLRIFGRVQSLELLKTEEKGSDVSLAVDLLNDGWLDAYYCFVVSNYGAAAEAMRLVREQLGKRTGAVTPGSRGPSQQLRARPPSPR